MKTIPLEELGCAGRLGERWLLGSLRPLGLLEQSGDEAAAFCSASEARAPQAGSASPAADRSALRAHPRPGLSSEFPPSSRICASAHAGRR